MKINISWTWNMNISYLPSSPKVENWIFQSEVFAPDCANETKQMEANRRAELQKKT